jgi:hypothetical protein
MPEATFVPDQFAVIFRTNHGWGKETVEPACRGVPCRHVVIFYNLSIVW